MEMLLEKCQTKSFEENEHSTQSNSQVRNHQPALQDVQLKKTIKLRFGHTKIKPIKFAFYCSNFGKFFFLLTFLATVHFI